MKKKIKIFCIIDEVKYIFKIKLREKNNKLKIINKSKILTLFNDPNRIKQLLINFISNSNKFTENGLLIVKIEDFNENLSIIVQDSGSGMSPKILSSIGEDFVTYNNTEN